MRKEITRQEGCLKGCLRSIFAGGVLGVVLGYYLARFFVGPPANQNLFLFIRWAFAAAGFLVGIFVWAVGEALYFYWLVKGEEEEVI